MEKKHWRFSLGWQIICGLIIGLVLGCLFKNNQPFIKLANGLGATFINLISMIVLPIIIASLTVGIASLGDVKKLGTIGLKTLIYFEILSTIAFILGMGISNLTHIGYMINLSHLKSVDISQYLHTAQANKNQGLGSLLMSIVPTNIFAALSKGKVLPIIFFCALFGLGTASIGKEGKIIIDFLNAVAAIMFKVTNWVMHFAPFGVAGLIAATVAELGLDTLKPLILFILLAYGTMLIFIFVVLGITSKIFGLKITDQLKVVKEELVLAFSTASSEVTLPSLMEKTQKLGVSKAISSFVIPTGYTFNLDGSAIYQGLAAIFMAQAYHIHLTFLQQLTLIITLMITSKGMAGVPGASFIVLMTSASAIGIPVSGLALIAGIDRLVDMGRTAVNVIGNVTATLVVGKLEHEFDQSKHDQYVAQITSRNRV